MVLPFPDLISPLWAPLVALMEAVQRREPPGAEGCARPAQGGDGADPLLVRAALGDDDALARLYEDHRGWMLRLARTMTGDWSRAEDHVHDTFLALSGARVKHGAAPRAYLATVLRRRIIDGERRLGLFRRKIQPNVLWLTEAEGAGRGGPDEVVSARRLVLRCQSALEELPAECAEVLVAHLIAGLSLKEIATAAGAPHSTIKSRYAKARDHLRVRIGDREDAG